MFLLKMNRPSLFETPYPGTVLAVEESYDNFNIPCKRRQELLYDPSKALRANEVPDPFRACVRVCDLGQLDVIVNNSRHALVFFMSFAQHCSHQRPILWLQEDQETDRDSVSSFSISTDSLIVIIDFLIKPGLGVYHEVRTGDKIFLKYAEHLPFPNKELLELQFR